MNVVRRDQQVPPKVQRSKLPDRRQGHERNLCQQIPAQVQVLEPGRPHRERPGRPHRERLVVEEQYGVVAQVQPLQRQEALEGALGQARQGVGR